MANNAKSNQTSREERKAQKAEKKLAAKKAEQKKSRQNKAIIAVILAIVLVFVGFFIYDRIKNSGMIERRNVVAKTENFSVTQAMMNYFFNTTYNSTLNQYVQIYGSISENNGSSAEDSIKTFVDSVDNLGEAYDQLMSSVKSQVETLLTYCEMAKAEGIELEKAEYDEIDAYIKSYKESKDSNSDYASISFDKYLSTYWGTGVNESVVRDCLKINYLASKYQEEKAESFEYTDDQLEEYYDANEDSYLYVDYLTATFTKPEEQAADETTPDTTADTAAETAGETSDDTAETPDENQDGENAENAEPETAVEEKNEAEANAEALEATTTPEEFTAFMKDYYTKEQEKITAEGEDVDTDAIDTNVEAISKTKQKKSGISNEELKDWLFGADTKVGTTKVVEDESAGTYTVYMLSKASYRDEEKTRNAAVIVLSDDNNDGDSKAKAEEVKAEWDALEVKDEEAFEKLSEKYSESSHHHVEKGITKDDASIGEWLFSDEAKVGEVGITYYEAGKASYLVYYAEEGEEGWKASVRSAKQSEDLSAAVEAFKTEHNVAEADTESPTVVTFIQSELDKIRAIKTRYSSVG